MAEVVDAFDAVARARPAAVALVARDRTLTFAELACASHELATRLRDAGVGQGDVVALALGRSAAHVVAMLASWRLGAAFLPLDEAAPAARVDAMLAEAHVRAVLTLAGDGVAIARRPSGAAPLARPSDELAYVVYTSGSTGRPKGVRVSHAGVVPMLTAQIAAFHLGPSSRALFTLSTAFDASISDIGTALLSGATLHVAQAAPNPARLVELLRANAITHADLPPATLPLVAPRALPASLETVIVGGDVCPPAVIRAWARRVRVVNVYGPTEATVCTSLCVCDADAWDRPLLGAPLPHVVYAIEAGELLIGGCAIALGYVDRPDLEARAFLARDGARWYRTGDLVSREHDGELRFVGRLDRQVKVRGRLVCPEEIEAALRAHVDVEDAAVDGRTLTAHVALRPGATATLEALHRALAESLPSWMVPRIVRVPVIARGTTGKVAPSPVRAAARDATIDDPRIRAIAHAFEAALGVPNVGADDDFMGLGGDSIGALEVAMGAQLAGVAVQPATVLAAKTPRAIASAPAARARTVGELDDAAARIADDAPPFARGGAASGGAWLVTGGSGFLGLRLLPELLARTTTAVHCLVRAASDAEARARLGPVGRHPRIVAHAADVSAPAFALAPATYESLARDVGHVVHGAATLSLALPFDALAVTNVRGALAVARFARTGGAMRVSLISSLAVLAASDVSATTLDEATALRRDVAIHGAYAQTKWVAEGVVRRLVADAVVIRPGLLTGDSATSQHAASCPLAAFLRAVATLGCVPDAEATRLRVDVTPVDHAARAIAEVVTSTATRARVHVASAHGASLADLVAAVGAATRVDVVSRELFLAAARQRLARDEAIALVAASYRLTGADAQREADLFLHTDRTFRSVSLRAVTGRDLPDLDGALLRRYAACAVAEARAR